MEQAGGASLEMLCNVGRIRGLLLVLKARTHLANKVMKKKQASPDLLRTLKWEDLGG